MYDIHTENIISMYNYMAPMLREILVDGEWKITGMRVLGEKTMEVSFNESGKIFGVEFSGAATVTSIVRPLGICFQYNMLGCFKYTRMEKDGLG